MKTQWNELLTIVLLLVVTSCGGSRLNTVPLPDGWCLYPMPRHESPVLECANHSENEWSVSCEHDTVMIRPYVQEFHEEVLPFEILPKDAAAGLAGDRHVLKLYDGWLVGCNAGEFGGALWWFSDTGEERVKLVDGNVVGVADTSSGIFVFAGLAHLGLDHGKMLFIQHDRDSPPSIQVTVDLGSAPWAYALESSTSVLLLTTTGLCRVWSSGSVEALKRTHYTFLYPNSMVRLPSGELYIGMRHFVTRLTPRQGGYREEWLVPQHCRRFTVHDGDCICGETE